MVIVVTDGNGLGGSTKRHGGIHCAGVPLYIGRPKYTTSGLEVPLQSCDWLVKKLWLGVDFGGDSLDVAFEVNSPVAGATKAERLIFSCTSLLV
jgi:hypothetical protein